MIRATLPKRGSDKWGSGDFNAPRGKRKHRGIDFAAYPGTLVHPEFGGIVTKIGLAYSGEHYTYVEVEDGWKFKARYFYIKPAVIKGQVVGREDVLGSVQKLDTKFEGITEHVHFEVRDPDGNVVHPVRYLSGEFHGR